VGKCLEPDVRSSRCDGDESGATDDDILSNAFGRCAAVYDTVQQTIPANCWGNTEPERKPGGIFDVPLYVGLLRDIQTTVRSIVIQTAPKGWIHFRRQPDRYMGPKRRRKRLLRMPSAGCRGCHVTISHPPSAISHQPSTINHQQAPSKQPSLRVRLAHNENQSIAKVVLGGSKPLHLPFWMNSRLHLLRQACTMISRM
jgi:hypothetical protein